VNREELDWLLQTIKGAATAERFVLTQYERGRISSEVMADVARERGWMNLAANQFFTAVACDSNPCESSESPMAIGVGADI